MDKEKLRAISKIENWSNDDLKDKSAKILIAAVMTNQIVNNFDSLDKSEKNLNKLIKETDRLKAIFDSIVYKVSYETEKQNWLSIAAQVSLSIMTKHPLYDQNKRTGIVTGILLLDNENNDISLISNKAFGSEEKIIEFVKLHEKNVPHEEIIKEIEIYLSSSFNQINNKILNNEVKEEKTFEEHYEEQKNRALEYQKTEKYQRIKNSPWLNDLIDKLSKM